MIPKLPEMIPANGAAKYREWRGLSMHVYLLWMYIYCLIFFCVRLLVSLSRYVFVRGALNHFYS